jgi:hypothetical protein
MRKVLTGSILLVAALSLAPVFTPAQDAASAAKQTAERAEAKAAASASKAERAEAKIVAEQHDRNVHAYRLDFSLNELEDGKKINSRHYTLSVVDGPSEEIKIGTRVPVATGGGENGAAPQFTYVDLGTNIWAMLLEKNNGDDLQLQVRAELSWAKTDDPTGASGQSAKLFTPPIVSQMKINGSTVITPGKPTIIGVAEDPRSNRQFQLEVTATKLK